MDFWTWAPFQSQAVRDIYRHMSEAEKVAASRHGGAFGLLAAIFLAGPIALGLTFYRSSLVGLTGLAWLAWIILGIFVMLYWRALGKRLLCATEWAKSQSITADKL